MAKKKDRAFFVCPRWAEIAGTSPAVATGQSSRVVTAISLGRPVARSSLRKALLALRQGSGTMFDVDVYIVDQRAAKPR